MGNTCVDIHSDHHSTFYLESLNHHQGAICCHSHNAMIPIPFDNSKNRLKKLGSWEAVKEPLRLSLRIDPTSFHLETTLSSFFANSANFHSIGSNNVAVSYFTVMRTHRFTFKKKKKNGFWFFFMPCKNENFFFYKQQTKIERDIWNSTCFFSFKVWESPSDGQVWTYRQKIFFCFCHVQKKREHHVFTKKDGNRFFFWLRMESLFPILAMVQLTDLKILRPKLRGLVDELFQKDSSDVVAFASSLTNLYTILNVYKNEVYAKYSARHRLPTAVISYLFTFLDLVGYQDAKQILY